MVAKLEAALAEALEDPKVVERFADLGTVPVPPDQVTPEALGAQTVAETAKWRPIIEAAGGFAD
ncbi:MAG: hypothetical protein WAS21_01495 [Geminicoccaceae bacterium]